MYCSWSVSRTTCHCCCGCGWRVPDEKKRRRDFTASQDDGKDGKHSFFELFRHPNLRRYTINLVWQLNVSSVVYYWISLGADSLGINIYVSFAVSGAVEIPAAFFAIFAMQYWGRRPSHIFLITMCGAALFATAFIPTGIWKAVVANVGKFAIAAAFNIMDYPCV